MRNALAAALGLAAARAAFEIRLVDQYGAVMDGSVSQTGRLEVRNPPSSTTWGTVCDDYWGFYWRNADIACDELFGTAAVSYDDYAPEFEAVSNSVPIYMDDVACEGTEPSLSLCAASAWGSENCNHYEDIHLTCEAVAAVAAPTPAPTPSPTVGCSRTIKVGTFDEANPYTAAVMSKWLDSSTACWAFYRQTSGGRSIAHLENGDLDVAMLGSTPFAAAAARRAALSAVSVLHLKGAAQALVTRSDLTGPVDLQNTILWTPYVSTTHYILLAAMSQMGIDVSDLTLETRSPAAIVAAWDAGTIDGAACWGNTMAYLLDNPHGATGEPGRAMVDAATVAQWGYDTGNVLGVSDAFLASDPALVSTIVEKFAQATYDYTNNQLSGLWDAGADYMAYVDDFVSRTRPSSSRTTTRRPTPSTSSSSGRRAWSTCAAPTARARRSSPRASRPRRRRPAAGR